MVGQLPFTTTILFNKITLWETNLRHLSIFVLVLFVSLFLVLSLCTVVTHGGA